MASSPLTYCLPLTCLLLASQVQAGTTSILFVGNSFTSGGKQITVQHYGTGLASDPSSTLVPVTEYQPTGSPAPLGFIGIPALFKRMTVEAGLDYSVSVEPKAGTDLKYHYDNFGSDSRVLNRAWDKVVLQDNSTLGDNASGPKGGNRDELNKYAPLIANLLHSQNAAVNVYLMSTWSTALATYGTGYVWSGQPISAMQADLYAAYSGAAALSPYINSVIAVGGAWNRAIETGFADANPNDGISPGKVNLWASDNHHGSVIGYYLEALTVFGHITGIDPRTLGSDEIVAKDLGISSFQAVQMQQIAFDTLSLTQGVPAPASGVALTAGLLALAFARRRNSVGATVASPCPGRPGKGRCY